MKYSCKYFRIEKNDTIFMSIMQQEKCIQSPKILIAHWYWDFENEHELMDDMHEMIQIGK